MSIVQFTRFKSGDREQVIQNARAAKQIVEKHGAEFLRLSRFHTGVGGRMADYYAMRQLGRFRQTTGGIDERP